jgi:hypothetical protein
MSNDNQESTINGLLKVFTDSPALLVIVIIVYIFTTFIGNKLDTLNETLTRTLVEQESTLIRMEDEAKDTKIFIQKQEEILQKLNKILDN